ncbi:O-acyltransferase WSD [Acinetobacter brisouii CIP 110357]|uniref:diacylglycerol O-acyltransferase n=1 Tax=Acinetobacter brisouii CIP 110357 TaxID=1341683 RepID=V2US67_9GAMM|nr:wax ester/triacylglycerol synthase family O-acyltransferase [Acinetobacter brisouii]ENV47570.1 O-acyltransferase WSD [Acinetobacter brisouii ANC 4119]ESK51456.1 O-acyltransferase WSD [Acinetobacter brisouii CIP 110357]
MRPLHPIDFIFLSLEKRQQPMHVGGLFLFQIPKNSPSTFIQDLVTDIRNSKCKPVAPFNNTLNGLFWDKDDEFDLDHHFRHIALPHPGRIRELLIYISQEHGTLIDRAKPLWTCTIIEGIEGNRFAMYFKIHHAMVDGVASMRLMEKSFAKDPNIHSIVPPWCIEKRRSQPETKNPVRRLSSKLSHLKQQMNIVPGVYHELTQALHDRRHDPDYVSSFQAPVCILNQRISASRRFAAQSFNLQRFRHIAKVLQITLNDVILAVCSGALREYLMSLNSLPAKPLIAMVPTSIRSDNDSDTSNRITMILANLATHISDPIERAKIISRSVSNAKTRFKRMTQDQILGYSAFVYAAAGLNIISGMMPKHQAFNLVISNVPGPREPLYWNGAKLEALYPASVVFDGQALNITLTSYLDKLEVGIVACRNTLPKVQSLLTLLEQEIQNYERHLGTLYVSEEQKADLKHVG